MLYYVKDKSAVLKVSFGLFRIQQSHVEQEEDSVGGVGQRSGASDESTDTVNVAASSTSSTTAPAAVGHEWLVHRQQLRNHPSQHFYWRPSQNATDQRSLQAVGRELQCQNRVSLGGHGCWRAGHAAAAAATAGPDQPVHVMLLYMICEGNTIDVMSEYCAHFEKVNNNYQPSQKLIGSR